MFTDTHTHRVLSLASQSGLLRASDLDANQVPRVILARLAAAVAASIRARLLTVAKSQGVDFNQVLVRFALERILYRMTQSSHADCFLLKGALLFTLWYDMPH